MVEVFVLKAPVYYQDADTAPFARSVTRRKNAPCTWQRAIAVAGIATYVISLSPITPKMTGPLWPSSPSYGASSANCCFQLHVSGLLREADITKGDKGVGLRGEEIFVTITQWQQVLLCIAWIWPVMTIVHYDSTSRSDIGPAVFWALVWMLCAARLRARSAGRSDRDKGYCK